MLKDLGIRTLKKDFNYIAECEVLDTDTNLKYYVVTQFGDLFYKTFDSSYIDYINGINKNVPQVIEGDNYLWFDVNEDRNITRFWKEYNATYTAAYLLGHRQYIKAKYSHLKKPLGNIKFKILNKRTKPVFGCGPMGDIYEIEFFINDTNEHLFVFSDDYNGIYSIYKESLFDIIVNEENGGELKEITPIELIKNFSLAKKSIYYDLYLEMEKYKDNY